jgi:2-pyrone-4,6-dicarboxylate lactonase
MPTAPRHRLPAGACDSHTHVFGTQTQFAVTWPPSYELPEAAPEVHAEMLAQVGLTRSVIVQPAPYGCDPSALLAALGRSPGVARGVAVTTGDVAPTVLRAWHDGGIRGLRFCEVLDSGTGKRFAGSVAIEELRRLIPTMSDLGWHAQVWAPCSRVRSIVRDYAAMGIPLVFEHMASLVTGDGVQSQAFQEVLSLLRNAAIWVKLDVCRVSRAAPHYDDARPFHRALIEANPERLLWASDWPFVRMGAQSPDVGQLIDLFHDWVPDSAVREMILVSNPAALYGFEHPPA